MKNEITRVIKIVFIVCLYGYHEFDVAWNISYAWFFFDGQCG